jgi:hypothetical protein
VSAGFSAYALNCTDWKGFLYLDRSLDSTLKHPCCIFSSFKLLDASGRCSVTKNNESEFGIRRETGEIYMLTKQERILTIEILRLTLTSAAGRKILAERFGKEGLNTAARLLEEMGIQIGELQGPGRRKVS